MSFPWARLKQAAIGVPILVPVVVLSVFVARGCDTASVPNVHPPPGVTLPTEPATSAPADLTGVQLAAVDGTTTLQALSNVLKIPAGVASDFHQFAQAAVHRSQRDGGKRLSHLFVGRWPDARHRAPAHQPVLGSRAGFAEDL